MADIDFRKNFEEIKARDDFEFETKERPKPQFTTAWLYFGLFLGITSIMAGFIVGSSFVAGLIGLICSIVGYKKQPRAMGIVAMVLCVIGIVWCFVNPLPRIEDLWNLQQQLKDQFMQWVQQNK